MQTENRKYASTSEMEEDIEELLSEGGNVVSGQWKVERQNDKSATMVHNTFGNVWVHLILFIIFGWWSFLMSNIVYAGAYYMLHSKQINMVVKEPASA